MKRSRYGGLIALNLAMIGVLMIVSFAPEAMGQRAVRPRGDYTMVSGRMMGVAENAVWVVDATNQELLALRWNRSQRNLVGIGYRNLADDARRGQGRGR